MTLFNGMNDFGRNGGNMIRKNRVKIALAQYPMIQQLNFEAWNAYTEKWIIEAVSSQADLLVFPEYASLELASFANDEAKKNVAKQIQYVAGLANKYVEIFQNFARQHSVCIIAPSIPFFVAEKNLTVNRCFIFSKNGTISYQDKLFMTRLENEEWGLSSGEALGGEFVQKIFETEIGNIAISSSFDVEFSEPSFSAALGGAELIIAPSFTDTTKGCNRVHIGARARALENQIYVAVSQTVGDAFWSVAMPTNTGYSALYSTPDLDFSDDGIVAKGLQNKSGWLETFILLDKIPRVREAGSVLNYRSRQALPSFGRIKYQIDVLR